MIDELPWLAPALKRAPTFLDDHFWNDGVARVSGRDFSSMMESKCFLQGELSCLSCHTMHHGDRTNQLQTIAFNNDACLQCHQTLRAKLTEHTHHAADSSGSSCYNCHMPYTTYGLMKAIRSHYIASPSVTNTLSTGRPNACNLCHLDKTLAWTANTLEQWRTHSTNATAPAEVMDRLNVEYRQTSAAVIDLLRGDAGQRALAAWSFGWEPARKASGEDWLAASLAPLLEDPYATVRYIAGRSLKRLPGYADFKYDYIAGAGERAAARAKALAQWPGAKSTPSRPSLLLDPAGKLDEARLNDLLSRRDNKRMDLQE